MTGKSEQAEKGEGGSAANTSAVSRRREIIILLAALILGGILLTGIYAIWNYDRKHPVTDDALLRANYVWIRPQVEGRVVELHVQPNEYVRAGQPLFRIDPRPYQHHLAKAEKQLVLVKQENAAGVAAVAAAKAQIKEQQAALKTANQYSERYAAMEKKQAASELSVISFQNKLDAARGKLLELQADLAKAEADLGGEEVQQARITRAKADIDLARLDLEWTQVTAPADGYVSRLTLRVGDVVQPDEQLFPFIESDHWWVHANFKETSVAGIKPGMPASITIDSYGDRVFHGEVESISSAAAASFALLPPQNTTGNWVKVTQRIPVRIRLKDTDPEYPYRFGASAQVTIDIKSPVDASAAPASASSAD